MSPPDTNLKKEERRHKPALLGIGVAVVAVVVFVIAIDLFGADEEVDEAASGDIIETE